MEIDKKCELTLHELYKFDGKILDLGPKIFDSRLEKLEEMINNILPEDFKYILKKHNGIDLAGTEIYGLSPELKGNSIDEIYKFEHSEVENPMPEYFLPFSPDGQGNHYCLDLSKLENNICPIVFWQWDVEYESIEEVEVCNSSFTDWIDEVMIQWTLKIYNYDGTEK